MAFSQQKPSCYCLPRSFRQGKQLLRVLEARRTDQCRPVAVRGCHELSDKGTLRPLYFIITKTEGISSFPQQVIVLFYARSRTAQAGRRSHSPARNNGRNSRRTGGRLEGTHEGQYRDDPSSEDENQATNPGNRRAITAGNSDANGTAQQHGPVLQASRLHEGQTDQNAWA